MNQSVLYYSAAAVVAVILGGFLGWLLFVRGQIATTSSNDSARGFGSEGVLGGDTGSSYTNLSGGSGAPVSGGGQGTGSPSASAHAPRFWHVARTPVAGLSFGTSSPVLLFAERASGNILAADPRTSDVSRLTNTLFPQTLEAVFAGTNSVILRSLADNGEIVTFAGTIATSTSDDAGDAPNRLEGVNLARNIISISARDNPDTAFFVTTADTGQTVGMTTNWQGAAERKVFSSSLSNWRTISLSDGSLFVLQKPSDDVAGYLYQIRTNGSMERVVGDVRGLMALPKSGSGALLYSTSEGGAVTLLAKTSPSATPIALPVKTVADKCVWAPGSALIAFCAVPQKPVGTGFVRNWYAGIVHTSDSFWKINVSANTAEEMYAPESNISVDAENLVIDSSGNYLAFMNAADKSLWMISLNSQ